MIRCVSSTTVRPISSTVVARLIRAEAAWRTSSWAARASVCSNSSALVRAMAAWVARVVMNATSPLVQRRGSRVTRRQGPDDPVVVDERRRRGGRRRRDAAVAPRPRRRVGPDVRKRPGPVPVRRTSPTQPSSRPRTGIRRASPRAVPPTRRPRGDRRGGVRIVVASARRPRLVSSTIIRNELGAVVRGGQSAGDAEDRVEALGEFGLEVRARSWLGDPLRFGGRCRPVGPDHPAKDRSAARLRRSPGHRGGHRRPGGDRRNRHGSRTGAHGSIVASSDLCAEPPSVLVPGRTIVPR